MEVSAKLMLPIAIVLVLVAHSPTEAWYKQVASPTYYSVGRASGLLSGIRRSPYVRRAEQTAEATESGEAASNSVLSDFSPQSFILKTMPVCIKNVKPNLQSCELLQETSKGSFKCKAEVFLSLDSSDCEEN